jgi:hypothetical protein
LYTFFYVQENIYYGSIFVCMTLIVIVCFLVINNRVGWGMGGSTTGGTAAAFYDIGKGSSPNDVTVLGGRVSMIL